MKKTLPPGEKGWDEGILLSTRERMTDAAKALVVLTSR